MVNEPKRIYQFKITLLNIKPKIWRRMQVSEEYSFWDLHVAIQDAMGWKDSHLHQFRIVDPRDGEESFIGVPNEENFIGEPTIIAGWDEFIRDYFSKEGHSCGYYEYDFGDDWVHEVKLEKVLSATSDCKYPICIAGERACPPEDCGGVSGYANLLNVINDPQHEEHESTLEWVRGKFKPEKFDPQKVHFHNPKQRWRYAIGSKN